MNENIDMRRNHIIGLGAPSLDGTARQSQEPMGPCQILAECSYQRTKALNEGENSVMAWHPDLPEEFRNCVIWGDMRDLIQRVPTDAVDLVVCDPPYNIKFTGYDAYRDDLPPQEYIHMLKKLQR